MKSFHTVIIGAGPAGLACATALARHGIDVLVIERSSRIGPKVCAGGVTYSGLGSRLPASLLEHSFTVQHVRTRRQRVRVEAPVPIISTVNRERLGQWMAGEATAAGATVLTGTVARRIEPDRVETDRGAFGYRHLVGADGSSSMVRRSLGIPSRDVGVGIHYRIPGGFDRMEWHLDDRLFANGYAWIFPHRTEASIGTYADRRAMPARVLFDRLNQWCREQGVTPAGRQEAALINYDYRGWRFGNTYLVGDAAGLASGLTGEGIYPAIVSGKAAARTILSPAHQDHRLTRLLRKHRTHSRLVRFTGRGPLRNRMAMELLVLALRVGLIHFSALEMADDRKKLL